MRESLWPRGGERRMFLVFFHVLVEFEHAGLACFWVGAYGEEVMQVVLARGHRTRCHVTGRGSICKWLKGGQE